MFMIVFSIHREVPQSGHKNEEQSSIFGRGKRKSEKIHLPLLEE
jgi:hypothetical protein